MWGSYGHDQRFLPLLLGGALFCCGSLAWAQLAWAQMGESLPEKPGSERKKPDPSPTPVPVDQLVDLSGFTASVATLQTRDSFANEFWYEVRVKNQTVNPLKADSLVIVLAQIKDLAGKDAMDRMEVVGYDGHTLDGKPYFRVPPGSTPILAPFAESQAAIVRLRNVDYTVVFTPSFRVLGQEPVHPVKGVSSSLDRLINILVGKGVLTREEGEALLESAHQPAKSP